MSIVIDLGCGDFRVDSHDQGRASATSVASPRILPLDYEALL
jgi:hypothetical protein